MNLTQVESGGASGTNDFYVDLSSAFWSPVTRRLWLCRNGPADTTSKVWALKENPTGVGASAWVVDTQPGPSGTLRAEWTNFGDAEGVTMAALNSSVVYVMAEGAEVIRAYDLSVYGTSTLLRTYNTTSFLPVSGGSGSEAICFVPDAYLRAAGFVTPAGQPYTSQRGMGGLMFVGHQNGGRVYAFDLSPTSTAFTFVGAYLTNNSDTSDLCFDRSTGLLYILHGNDVNTIEVATLASSVQGSERRLSTVVTYNRPTGSANNANIEGLAIVSQDDCVGGVRSAFLTVDGGGATSLLWFRNFPCRCRPDVDGDHVLTILDIFAFLNSWFAAAAPPEPQPDFDFNGVVDTNDIFTFLNAWFAGC